MRVTAADTATDCWSRFGTLCDEANTELVDSSGLQDAIIGAHSLHYQVLWCHSLWVIALTSPVPRHYSSWDTECLRNWVLEGSNDALKWTTLMHHRDDKVPDALARVYVVSHHLCAGSEPERRTQDMAHSIRWPEVPHLQNRANGREQQQPLLPGLLGPRIVSASLHCSNACTDLG